MPPVKESLPKPPLIMLLPVLPARVSSNLEPIKFSIFSRISPVASPPVWAVVSAKLTVTDALALT